MADRTVVTMTEKQTSESSWTVGSVADEAIQLLDAARRWIDHQQHERGQSDPAANDGEVSEACKFCPVCQLISAVKKTSPEAVEQFACTAETLIVSLRSNIASREHEWKRPTTAETIDIKVETAE